MMSLTEFSQAGWNSAAFTRTDSAARELVIEAPRSEIAFNNLVVMRWGSVTVTSTEGAFHQLSTELTPLESTLKSLAVIGFEVVKLDITDRLLGVFERHVRGPQTLYYMNRFPSGSYRLPATFVSVLEQGMVEALGGLQRDLNRFRRFERNWDGCGAEPFSETTLVSAQDVVGQAYNAALTSAAIAPVISPGGDGRICFSWKTDKKELWIYVEGKTADVYRWQPIHRHESDAFEQIPISQVREHIDWVLS